MGIDVRAHVHTVRKRWPILVLAVAASVGGTFAWTYRQPRIFEASCSVIIDSMAPQYLQGIKDVVEMGTGSYWGNREFHETQYRIMTSKDIALRAVDKLGLVNDIDYPVPNTGQVKNRTPEMLAGMVAGQTKIVPVKESRIANIVVRDRLPQRAALIANAMADAYIEKNLEYKMEESRTAQDWFLDLRSMVVTSPGPQEGKTTTAISLAISTAMGGTRVILVDTDLRRPRVHRSVGLPNVTGVSNLIVGETTLEAVRHTEVPNLDVLTCGPTPPNPAEWLHTERFKNLIRDLTARYDRVIFDSPPTSLVTDPAVIANLTDGVMLVVRGGVTTRDAAAYARRQLGDAKAHILGAIINHVDLSDKGYYYHYVRYYRGYSKYGRYYADASDGGKA